MSTDSISVEEERRRTALSLAVTLISEHGGFSIPQDSALVAAKDFEKYLKDGAEA